MCWGACHFGVSGEGLKAGLLDSGMACCWWASFGLGLMCWYACGTPVARLYACGTLAVRCGTPVASLAR